MFLFLFLFIVLFRQIWRLDKKVYKWTTFGLLTLLAIPYLFIGLWTALLTWSNYHPMWQDLFIYTNDKNEKVISQWRETSGSIYDYRDRKIIADYGQFRISFDCDAKKLEGISLRKALVGIPIWTIGGLGLGYTMKLINGKNKPKTQTN